MPELDIGSSVAAIAIDEAFVPTYDHLREVGALAIAIKRDLDAIDKKRRALAERIADRVASSGEIDGSEIATYNSMRRAQIEASERLEIVLEEVDRAQSALKA